MGTERGERILVMNPGSTSTKVAVFHGDEMVSHATLPVPNRGPGGGAWEELPDRLLTIREWLDGEGLSVRSLHAVVARGGLLRPVEGGTYEVTEAMLVDSRGNFQGSHASNLGCALARAIADEEDPRGTGGGIPALVVDPVSTDEFCPLARYSGLREIPRRSLSHALSIHALVREACRRDQRALEGSAFVVGHLGGGISVCPVRDGRILDANNANSGGPFSPSRSGGLPIQELLDLACSGDYSRAQLRSMTLREGGLVSYLGTDDAREVEARIADGDEVAREVYQAMAYQIAKEIGAMATVLEGGPEAILLTGGLATSELLVGWIRERVSFLAPVEVFPAMEELRALAQAGLRVLRGEERARPY
ncbi:MAG: butyrate kinase [Gemmatimonadota bacterium]|jgi:butyrate kinase